MKVLIIIILFCCAFPFENCKSKSRIAVVDSNLDSITTIKQVSIKELARNYKSLNGQLIQVKGKFSFNFEDVALYDYGLFKNKNIRFWLNFNNSIISDKNGDMLKQLSGKKVIVKGQIDSFSRGHLSWYLASIDNIYSIRED